jgi:molybdenum cofactor cytidylyltransferase
MESVHTEKIGILLLAAGSSSRMGEPKQLLKIDGQLLIQVMTQQALEAKAYETIVIIGHRADEIKKVIEGLPVKIIFNEHAEKGMGNSIKCGISYLKENQFSAALIMTCDQPMLKADHLKKLIGTYNQKRNPIVASSYAEAVGIPALFDSKLFDSLLTISDNQGAKKIISQNLPKISALDFPEGKIDLDTPDDYRAYQQLIDKTKNP